MEKTHGGMVSVAEDRIRTGIIVELGLLVTQGLLEMSINEVGDAVYWATDLGQKVLGMAT